MAGLLLRRHLDSEMILDQTDDARVRLFPVAILDDEKRGMVDAETVPQHHPWARRVVLDGPKDFVDTIPQAAAAKVLGGLGALPALGAIFRLFLHHGDVHKKILSPAADGGKLSVGALSPSLIEADIGSTSSRITELRGGVA